MGVLKEFRCAAHGAFESDEAECPYGCSDRFVTQEFRTAPRHMSRGTKINDGLMRGLADDYRLPDIKSEDNGQSVMQNLRRNPSHMPTWGKVDHAAPGFSERGDVKTFNPGSMGVASENALAAVKPILHQPRPSLINKSTPADK
jgi:hypothetical protein